MSFINKINNLAVAFLAMIVSCAPIKSGNEDEFSFVIEDVYRLSSGKLVVVGQIKSGQIEKSEKLKIVINNMETYVAIEKMEIFAKPNQSDIAFKNDYVGFTISGFDKSQLNNGMIFRK